MHRAKQTRLECSLCRIPQRRGEAGSGLGCDVLQLDKSPVWTEKGQARSTQRITQCGAAGRW